MKREVKISTRVPSNRRSRSRAKNGRLRKNVPSTKRNRSSAVTNADRSNKLSKRLAQRSAIRKANLRAKFNFVNRLKELASLRLVRRKFPANPKYFQDPTIKPRKSNNSSFWPTPLKVALRLAVIVIGLSTIFGSGLAISDSLKSEVSDRNLTSTTQSSTPVQTSQEKSDLEQLFSMASVGKEIVPLKQELQTLIEQYPELTASIFIADIANKTYVNIQGTEGLSAASTIKVPILVAFFQDVDAGKIKLDEIWTMNQKDIGSGSGHMQYQPVGTKFSALNTATKMITISDNTATNMVIRRLGGVAALNQRFTDWGLYSTKIRNPLPDLTGTNTTSPEDLSNLLRNLEGGKLVSLRSRDRMFQIMGAVERNTLLPQGLAQGATIVHKTGDIRSVLGDSGIVDMPSGKRYIISVLVKRPDNSPQAKPFIQKISKIAYQYFQEQSSNSQATVP